MRADDIVRQRFTKVFRGYDVQEVDLFLDEVIRSMDTLEKERNQLLARLEMLLRELDRAEQALAARQESTAEAFSRVQELPEKSDTEVQTANVALGLAQKEKSVSPQATGETPMSPKPAAEFSETK